MPGRLSRSERGACPMFLSGFRRRSCPIPGKEWTGRPPRFRLSACSGRCTKLSPSRTSPWRGGSYSKRGSVMPTIVPASGLLGYARLPEWSGSHPNRWPKVRRRQRILRPGVRVLVCTALSTFWSFTARVMPRRHLLPVSELPSLVLKGCLHGGKDLCAPPTASRIGSACSRWPRNNCKQRR